MKVYNWFYSYGRRSRRDRNSRQRRLRIEQFESRFMLHGGVDHGSGHLDLAAILSSQGGDGFDGVVVSGTTAGDNSGHSVHSAGDFNGDGFEDLVVGAPAVGSSAGAVYVLFGSNTPFSADVRLSSLNGSNGIQMLGSAGERAGTSVSSAGDVNHDGFSDIVIGAPSADPASRIDAGSVYVVFGRSSGFSSTLALSSLNGTNGFRLNGVAVNDAAGASVAGTGDVNYDGFADIIVGAAGADPNSKSGAGSAYVVLGKSSFASVVELSNLSGANGFRLDGSAAGDEFGFSVASAGDINRDGYSELLIGAPGASPNSLPQSGSTYLVFGAANFSASTNVSSLTGTNGFRLDGENASARSGYSVSGNGDVNADGFDDILIGSPRAKVHGVSIGAAYAFYGKATGYTSVVALESLDGTTGFKLSGDYESDPLLNSFIVNTTGATAHQIAGQNTPLVTNSIVNFTSVIPDDTSVYVTSSGIPALVLGPWAGNPSTVSDQSRTHKIPRLPTVNNGTKTTTTLGSTGVWIDGVAIYNWSDGQSFNNARVWNQNAIYFEGSGLDGNGGHPPRTGEYHTHAAPTGLMTRVGDNGSGHSPILGWSYDGYPIYGPYGFTNRDGTGAIERKESSWKTRNITTRTTYANGTSVAAGPTVATTPLGAYVEDYEFVQGLGDLDKYNGIFSVTPEYPDGIYHYVVSIDSVGKDAFPYVIGLEYYGNVESANLIAAGSSSPGGSTLNVGTPNAAAISVALGGDYSHDGIDDILVGDPDAYVSGKGVAGVVSIVYGKTIQNAELHLTTLDGSNGRDLYGAKAQDQTGLSVAFADFNGDGLNGVIVGAPGGTASPGETFVVFGQEAVGLTIHETNGGTVVSENGSSDSFTVVLNEQPTRTVTVTISSSNSSEVIVDLSSLTFTTSNWYVPQTVRVTGISDRTTDGSRNAVISLTTDGSDANYAALRTRLVQVTNIDTTFFANTSVVLTSDSISGSHIVSASSSQTSIVFYATQSTKVTVTPASELFTPRLVDENLRTIGGTDGNVYTAEVSSGRLYSVVFEASSIQQTYSIQSSAGDAALSTNVQTNFIERTDTNGDGLTSPIDVLLVINQLRRIDLGTSATPASERFFWDVTWDGVIAPIDVLVVINFLRRQTVAEGEGAIENLLVDSAPIIEKRAEDDLIISDSGDSSFSHLGSSSQLLRDADANSADNVFASNNFVAELISEDSRDRERSGGVPNSPFMTYLDTSR